MPDAPPGFAPEYVEGMWLMLQQAPWDLVFGTGETHWVLECVEAFGYVNLDWRDHVTEGPRYRRPTEVPLLRADPSEAKRRLGWEPGVTFRDLVRIMMDAAPRGRGPTRARAREAMPDRGSAGVAQEAVKDSLPHAQTSSRITVC